MIWIDIVVVIIVAGLVIHGVIIGLIRSLFDIAGIIAGYLLAVHYGSTLRIPSVLAFILIFVVVVIVVSLLGRIVSKIVHVTPLGLIDRILGGVLGLCKALVISFVFLLVVLIIHKSNDIVMKAEIAPLVLKGGLVASQVLPEKWSRWLERLVEGRALVGSDASDYISQRFW